MSHDGTKDDHEGLIQYTQIFTTAKVFIVNGVQVLIVKPDDIFDPGSASRRPWILAKLFHFRMPQFAPGMQRATHIIIRMRVGPQRRQ
jgi:hypothetical protein